MKLRIVTTRGSAREVSAHDGQSLLDALREADETMIAPCGGAGTCGRCKLLVRGQEGVGYRLACQTPAVDGLEILLEEMDTLKIEGAQRRSTEAVRDGSTFGLAVDIGTTTMVSFLVDLQTREVIAAQGKVNPQVTFGADVIARIDAAEDHEKMNSLCRMLRAAIDEAETRLCSSAGIDGTRVERRCLVGNTTMQHFACGLSPISIGVSPFVPLSLFGAEASLYQPAGAVPKQAYLAPAVAGYVGGDITAGLVVAGMRRSPELRLFIDIGTNGEMALGNRDRMLCCATAAGPAFEGAGIAFGMPAMRGAISKMAVSTGGFVIETVDNAPAIGICGSGLLDAVASLVIVGLVDETGYLLDAGEAAGTIGSPWDSFVGEEGGQRVCYLDEERRVFLAQADIRKVQLAKAAIRAGIETMAKEWGAACGDIESVALAGGFGMHLNPHSATAIGLIPPVLDSRIEACGNTAGKGAVECLFEDGRAETAAAADACEYLELSTSKIFNEKYIDSMGFED